MSKLTYSGGKGHYFVYDGEVTVGSIAKGETSWIGHFTGASNDDRFVDKTRDKVLALMEASVNDVTASRLEIDATMALQSLKDAVALRGGNFIYQEDGFKQGVAPAYNQRCMYEWRGQASCGVGVALHTLGVPISTLTLMDANSDGAGTQIATVDVPGVTLTDRARAIYSGFQVAQDGGRRWGYSLDIAESAAGVVG